MNLPATPHSLGSLASKDAAHPEWIWRSGTLVPWAEATIHVNAVGHASVAAVFEGIKAYRAEDGERLIVFRLDDHLDRLAQSSRLCRLTPKHSVAEIRDAVLDVLHANKCRQDTYLRPWLFPEGTIREQMVPAGAPCEVVVDSWAFESNLLNQQGCRAAVSSWLRVNESSAPPRAKAFSNYHNGRLALIEARQNGHDWPVLLNEQHKVSEGAGACIGLVRDGVVSTPSLTSGVLDGITRSTVLTLLEEMGIPRQERVIDRSELLLADELFFMGTAWEVLPITTIDGLTVGDGAIGEITARLQREYSDIVRGRTGRHQQWLTEVPLEPECAPEGNPVLPPRVSN